MVVWEKYWEFQMTSPLKPLGQLKSHVEPPWGRGMKGCLRAESLHKSSRMECLSKLLKWWSYIDVWPFYSKVKFASVWICMGSIHWYGKDVDNFRWFLLWSLRANVAQISSRASLGQGKKRLLKWSWSIDQDAMPYMVKTFQSSSPE